MQVLDVARSRTRLSRGRPAARTATLAISRGLQILDAKTRKLEQLVRLKDAKIDTLTAELAKLSTATLSEM